MDDTNDPRSFEEYEDLVDNPTERFTPVEIPVGLPSQQTLAYELWNLLTEDQQWSDEFAGWIWDGRISGMHGKLGISQPYFQAVYTHLQRMGCISTLRRGGGGRSSVLSLTKEPTQDLWETGRAPTKARSVANSIQQQLRDLNARVTYLEQQAHIHPEGI